MICREHSSSSQYSKLKRKAVPICSFPCDGHIDCKVCDAARATSAAPTFFPVMRIGDRFFADGGLAHNNPSFAIFYHYTSLERKKAAQPNASAPSFSPHGELDCSRVRFTNIGTGAKVDEVELGKRDRLVGFLIPRVVRRSMFLKQTLLDIATNAEEKADIMRQFQALNPTVIMYERFDASHGVSNFKLDDHQALGRIKEKTELYLKEQKTIDLLEEVGLAIALDYIDANPTVRRRAQTENAAIDESHEPTCASDAALASSALSADSAGHSGSSTGEPHLLSRYSDELHTNKPLTGQQETVHHPIGKEHTGQYNGEDSGLGTIEPKVSVTVVAA